jgi:translation initiation factor 2-alpha kinase 4
LIDKALDGPIAAIDTRDDILEAIRDTRLSDPDSWRTVIQNAPLTERKYLGQVHELLDNLANEGKVDDDSTEGHANAFIYNYRTGTCIYYDLIRSSQR